MDTLGQLCVWWIPQVPMKAFRVPVKSPEEAKLVLKTLADYDIFQVNNRVKPDCCNTGGLEVFEHLEDEPEPGWIEWYSEDGLDIWAHDVLEEAKNEN